MHFLLISNIIFLGYSPEVSTDLLWWLTYFFTAIAVFYFGFSFFFKRKLNFGIKSTKTKKKELAQIISQFLFMEEDATSQEKQEYLNLKIKIRELLKTKRNRKILAEVIVELRQDLSGDSLDLLMNLYKDLGLDKDAFAKLYNWKWFTVSQGIFELTRMKVDGAYSKITKFINDRRSIIRKQAELSVVTLHNNGINYFLDTTDKNISEWQQLKMLDILIKKPNFDPPSFKNWLISKNKDTVLFCIRLIKYYKQLDAGNAISELIRHKDATIRSESVICAKEFRLINAAETLKSVFLTSTNDCKLLIIDTIESFGRQEDIEFLKLVKDSKDAFAIKNKAGSAINCINPNTEINTKDLEVVSNDYLIQLLNNQEADDLENHIPIKSKAEKFEDKINEDSTLNEVEVKSSDEETHLNIEVIDEIEITTEVALEINDKTKDLIDFDKDEIIDTSELINFEIEESKDDTSSNETPIKFFEEDENKELEEDNSVPIDDVKHIEFIEYMSTISASDAEKEEKTAKDDNLYNELFFNKNHYEKFNLLTQIEESGDKNEIPLLEAIMVKETNSNIKEKATAIYKQIMEQAVISEKEEKKTSATSKPVIFPAQTVFKDLYYSCDTEAKLILLEEIGALGDSIELKFLVEELSSDEEIIRKKAAQIIAIIENRLAVSSDEFNKDLTNSEIKKKKIIEKLFDESKTNAHLYDGQEKNEDLIPLEYCFLLNDLDIKSSKEPDSDNLDINFDISDEYFLSS